MAASKLLQIATKMANGKYKIKSTGRPVSYGHARRMANDPAKLKAHENAVKKAGGKVSGGSKSAATGAAPKAASRDDLVSAMQKAQKTYFDAKGRQAKLDTFPAYEKARDKLRAFDKAAEKTRRSKLTPVQRAQEDVERARRGVQGAVGPQGSNSALRSLNRAERRLEEAQAAEKAGGAAKSTKTGTRKLVDKDAQLDGYMAQLNKAVQTKGDLKKPLAALRADRSVSKADMQDMYKAVTGAKAPASHTKGKMVDVIEQSLDQRWKLRDRGNTVLDLPSVSSVRAAGKQSFAGNRKALEDLVENPTKFNAKVDELAGSMSSAEFRKLTADFAASATPRSVKAAKELMKGERANRLRTAAKMRESGKADFANFGFKPGGMTDTQKIAELRRKNPGMGLKEASDQVKGVKKAATPVKTPQAVTDAVKSNNKIKVVSELRAANPGIGLAEASRKADDLIKAATPKATTPAMSPARKPLYDEYRASLKAMDEATTGRAKREAGKRFNKAVKAIDKFDQSPPPAVKASNLTRSNKVIESWPRKLGVGREGPIARMFNNWLTQRRLNPAKAQREALTKAINSNNLKAARDQLLTIIPASRARRGLKPLTADKLDREIASSLRFLFNK